jgi:hypothetical protein
MALGYLGGCLLEGDEQHGELRMPSSTGSPESVSDGGISRHYFEPEPREQGPGLRQTLTSEFTDEFNKVKSLAVGAGLGLFRDFLLEKAPEALRPRIAEVIDSTTAKLGGEVVRGPMWQGESTT